MTEASQPPGRVALAGFGTVGRMLAERLSAGAIPELRLTAVSARDLARASENSAHLNPRPAVVPVAELPDHADIVVECATGDALPEIARAVLTAGKTLVPVSVGAIARHPEIIDLARRHGGRIRIPSGTMVGMDALRGAAEGDIRSVRLQSRIRPDSLAREAYIIEQGHDFSTPPAQAIQVFTGTAAGAAAAFPKHFNVAVTLSLAGIGMDRTSVEVWADPDIPGAIHQVDVEAAEITFTSISRNLPSENPRTSRIVAPSILAALRALVSPIQVGS
jgi:aspartate dehydrogenase